MVVYLFDRLTAKPWEIKAGRRSVVGGRVWMVES